jgi:cyanoexosortase B
MMQLKSKLNKFQEEDFLNFIIGGLLGILYLPIISHWYDGWLNKNISIEHEYFSHGLIGFPFAVYIIWINRKKWQRLENKFHPLGAFLLGLGACFYVTGVTQLVHLSFPIVLTGICLWLKGMPGLNLQKIPLLFILLATPNSVPYLITSYTLPLQTFIAGVVGFILIQLGFDVNVQQIYLSIGGRLVEVAPYCAGLKMLFTSLYVAFMLLYWTDNLHSRKNTILLLFGAGFISVTANIIRNTLLAFFHGTNQDAMFDWLHEGWGGDVYSAMMLGVIIVLLKVIEHFNLELGLEPELETNLGNDQENESTLLNDKNSIISEE